MFGFRKINLPLLLTIGADLFVLLVLQTSSLFLQAQNLAYDKFFIRRDHGEKLIILSIDDPSLQVIGAWPWNRSVFATVVRNLEAAGARVIAFDVVFGEQRGGDSDFASALEESNSSVVLAGKLEDGVFISPDANLTDSQNTFTGFVNFEADFDGKVRKALVKQQVGDDCIYSFALQAARLYVNDKDPQNCASENLNVGFSSFKTTNGSLKINFIGPAGSFPQLELYKVYNNEFDPTAVKDKIVLIGSTIQDIKSDLQDNLSNPFDGQVIPGVEMHANVINTILEKDFLYDMDPYLQLACFALGAIFIFWMNRRLNHFYSFLGSVLLLCAYLLLAAIMFGSGIVINLTIIPYIIVSFWIIENLWQYYLKRKENLEIKKAFGQYVNPELLQQILSDPSKLRLGGDTKDMSVLFSDIRGFTSISEKVKPEILVRFLNIYLTKITQVILDNSGMVDKYIGDAVMALWGAPLELKEHSYYAAKSALKMLVEVNNFNKEHSNMFPPIKVGIGINSGKMVSGNMGGEQRFDYTVLGDNVNLASRLEGLTKYYGVSIILGENTYKHLKKTNNLQKFLIRHLDTVVVKGKQEKVRIYELMPDDDNNREIQKLYFKAFQDYRQGKFSAALKKFKLIAARFKDGASKLMCERCNEFVANPPKDWDGSWSWVNK